MKLRRSWSRGQTFLRVAVLIEKRRQCCCCDLLYSLSHYHITPNCLSENNFPLLTKCIFFLSLISLPSCPSPVQKVLLCHTSAELPLHIYFVALCSGNGSSVIIIEMSRGTGISRFISFLQAHLSISGRERGSG